MKGRAHGSGRDCGWRSRNREATLHVARRRRFPHVEEREDDRESEEKPSQPTGKRLQNVGRLRPEKVVGHSAAESRAKPFVFRPLHQHREDDQQRNENVKNEQNVDQDRHGARTMEARLPLVNGSFPLRYGGESDQNRETVPPVRKVSEACLFELVERC